MGERLLVLLVIEKASREPCVDIYAINPELIVTFLQPFNFQFHSGMLQSAFRLLFNISVGAGSIFVFIHVLLKEGKRI